MDFKDAFQFGIEGDAEIFGWRFTENEREPLAFTAAPHDAGQQDGQLAWSAQFSAPGDFIYAVEGIAIGSVTLKSGTNEVSIGVTPCTRNVNVHFVDDITNAPALALSVWPVGELAAQIPIEGVPGYVLTRFDGVKVKSTEWSTDTHFPRLHVVAMGEDGFLSATCAQDSSPTSTDLCIFPTPAKIKLSLFNSDGSRKVMLGKTILSALKIVSSAGDEVVSARHISRGTITFSIERAGGLRSGWRLGHPDGAMIRDSSQIGQSLRQGEMVSFDVDFK